MAATVKLKMNIPASSFKKGRQAAIDGGVGARLEPNRRYDATLVDAKTATVSGELKLIVSYDCPEANEGSGGIIKIWYSPMDEEKSQYLFRDLDKLGYDIEKMATAADVNAAVEDLMKEKPSVRFSTKASVKDGKEYVNAFIDCLTPEGGGDEAPAENPAEEVPAAEEPVKVVTKAKPAPAAAAPAAAGVVKKRGRPAKPAVEAPEPEAEPAAEPEAEPEAEAPASVDVGSKITWTKHPKLKTMEITEINEAEAWAKCKAADGKVYKVPAAELAPA